MSKIIVLEINHCFACKFHYRERWDIPSKWMCETNEYREIDATEVDTNGKDFPLWCPLPDKKESN